MRLPGLSGQTARLPWTMIRSIWQKLGLSTLPRARSRWYDWAASLARWMKRAWWSSAPLMPPSRRHPLDGEEVGSRRDGADERAGAPVPGRDQTSFYDHVLVDQIGHRISSVAASESWVVGSMFQEPICASKWVNTIVGSWGPEEFEVELTPPEAMSSGADRPQIWPALSASSTV